MTKEQRSDHVSTAGKDASRASYTRKVRERFQEVENRKKPKIWRRAVKNEAEEFVAVCVRTRHRKIRKRSVLICAWYSPASCESSMPDTPKRTI